VSVRTVNRVVVVRLLGCERLHFEAELDLLRNDLMGILDEPCDLVLNLTGIEYFSSATMGVIVSVRQRAGRGEGEWRSVTATRTFSPSFRRQGWSPFSRR
jgi:anti-anti-sigma regulatory factor